MGWSNKYKRSIDCNNPKGFSQKAHCAGRKIRKENMKLSELKDTIRDLIQERSVNAISKAQQKNAEEIAKILELYKKAKGGNKYYNEKNIVKVLKKLGQEKKKLEKEMDDKISSLYKNADYKGPIDEGSINEGPSKEEFRIAAMAIKKQAKFRNVSPEQAIQDQLNALKLLQRYIKKGDVKKYTGMNLSEASAVWKIFDMKQRLYDDAMNIEMDMKSISKDMGQIHKDMEQEAEPSGGKIADRYGKQLDSLEKQYKKKKLELKKVFAKLDKLERY